MRAFAAVCLLLSASAAFAAEPPKALPLANAGFEQEMQGWAVGAFAAQTSLDKDVKHGGAAALRIKCEDGKAPFAAQVATGLNGGATYSFRVWYRGVKGGKGDAALKIEFYNDKKENTSGHYARQAAGSDEWRLLVVEAQADPDATRASLLLRLFGPGEVWFDDAEFVQAKEPPAITIAPVRVAQSPGEKGEVRLKLRVFGEQSAADPAILLEGPHGTVKGVSARITTREGRVSEAVVSLPALSPGGYTLKATVPAGSGECRLFVPPARRRPANLSETGTLLVGGKPFFPIGIYHVGPLEYPLLAATGFNCVQGAGGGDVSTFKNSLDAAQKAGILVDVPFYVNGQVGKNMATSLKVIRECADHPAVLNWKIIDEPDLRPDVVDEVPVAYEQLKEADPAHPLLLTIASWPSFTYWANFCDILQIDPYPIPSQPLTMVSDYTKEAKKVLQPWQNLTAVLQSGWLPGPPSNQPTNAQARAMVYLALIHGAKGIFWYSMHDPGWDLSKTPLWERFKDLNEETARLGQIVMSGEPLAGTRCENEALHAAVWSEAGKIRVLVTNPGKDAQAGTLSLPRPAPTLKVIRGEGTASVKDGAIALSLPAIGSVLLEE